MALLRKFIRIFSYASFSAFILAGCGLGTPSIQSPLRSADTDQIIVNIVLHVKHELECVAYALKINDTGYVRNGKTIKNLPWLNKAVAKVTLNLTVDEKTSLAPSLASTKIFPNNVTTFAQGGNVTTGQSFTLGVSGNFSAEANRKLSTDYTYSMQNDLLADESTLAKVCDAMTGARTKPNTGMLIDGDLKIGDSFIGMLKPYLINNPQLGATTDTATAPDTLQVDITFTLDGSGTIGPMWKLVPVSYFPGATSLATADRHAIDEVIVTIGAKGPATDKAHDIAKQGSKITTPNTSPN